MRTPSSTISVPAPARRRATAGTLATAVSALILLMFPAAQAGAGQGTGNPVLTVSTSTAQADRVTDITVTGTDFLVPPYAPGNTIFGGVYVFFGWVSSPSSFGPSIRNSTSNDGTYGVTYSYPGSGGDPGTRDPGTGTMRLVAFTPGGESGSATDFHMDREGNWSTQMRIYGSTFTYTYPPTGEVRTVDCQVVQCGVFTIGAHGRVSSTNEVFTPIDFTGESGGTPITIPPPAPSTTSTLPATTTTTAPTTNPSGEGDPTPGQGSGERPGGGEPDPSDDPDAAGDLGSGPTTGGTADGDDEVAGDVVTVGVNSVRTSGSVLPVVLASVVGVLAVAGVATAFLVGRRNRRTTTGGT